MASQWPIIMIIGPLVPSLHSSVDEISEENDRINLFKPQSELNTKDSSSVVYVSFGSSAVLGGEQLEELAWGLAQSNCHFLWAVRDSEESKKTSEEGMPVWVDQKTNTKFMADVLKVGVRVKVNEKRIATSEEIETCVKEVIEGDRKKKIKKTMLLSGRSQL
uniref:UDP-glycosyltransferase 74C1-like n=1 Tax=Nicotiana sylvestris TaxID=4096 RepID=A0A1U7W3D2_NICSY|nr:PREDICTED: UDP-glycosyltransferase 74C1-like [Nicotiana sylvestris]